MFTLKNNGKAAHLNAKRTLICVNNPGLTLDRSGLSKEYKSNFTTKKN